MNQMDMAATPMRNLFTTSPDFTPYDAVPNQIPLTEMNPGSDPLPFADPTGRATAATPTPPAIDPAEKAMRQAWTAASDKMGFTDPTTPPDQTDWNLLNHAIWYATEGYDTPYPGEQRVLAPDEVPSYWPKGGEQESENPFFN